MKMVNKESFAILPNVAFGFETEYKLNQLETLLYIHMQFIKPYGLENQLVTMVDILLAGIDYKVSNISRDRKKVVKALESLHDKGYITIECDGLPVSSVLTITIHKEMEKVTTETFVDWKGNSFKWSGFTKIQHDEYNLAECNGYHLIVLAYTKWRENADFTWKIAYKEWEGVLEVSNKTAGKIIAECDSFIEKISGKGFKDENGNYQQEANTYKVDTESKVKPISSTSTNMSYLEKFREKVTDLLIKFDDNLLLQMTDKNTKVDSRGYKAWRETDCPVYIEAGEKTFEILGKAGQGWIKENLEEEYLKRLSDMERQEALMKKQLDQLNESGEYQTSFKKKEKTVNIYDFLDEEE